MIAHVIRLILQFDGSGQGLSVEGCSTDTHAHIQTKDRNRSALFRVTTECTIFIAVS